MKKIHCTIVFLCSVLSQTVPVYVMESKLQTSNQIIEENLVNMHLEIGIPISLIKQATIISYPRYIYGEYEEPDIPLEPNTHINPQNKLYECPLCNRSFTQKKLMLHIKATNIKPLHNLPLNGYNNNDIDDEYFLEWVNK